PQPLLGAGADDIIHPACLFPKAELAGADVASDAFGGSADQGELPVVDRPRAVEGKVIEHATLHEFDEVTGHARPQDVSTHQEDAGAPAPVSCDEALP